MKIHPRLLAFVLIIVLMAACAPAPTAAPTATTTPLPTPTLAPTGIPTLAPTETPTLEPTEAPVPVEIGPVSLTGEEAKLIHTQNATDSVGGMISPEVFAAREAVILDVRQRTLAKLAVEAGVSAPENDLTTCIKWLYGLKNDGMIDDTKLWEYLGNMLITSQEALALVQSEGPVNEDMKYGNNVTPGIDFGQSQLVRESINTPNGVVEFSVPDSFQGKVLAIVPSKLIPGSHEDLFGTGYLIVGDEQNNPFYIYSAITLAIGDKMYSNYWNNGKDVKKMPEMWWGYSFPTGHVGKATYYKATDFYNWGMAAADNINVVKPTSLDYFEGKYVRVMWIWEDLGAAYYFDANGVMGTTSKTAVVIGSK